MSEATDVSSLTLASVAALREPKIVDGPNGRTYVLTPTAGNGPNAHGGWDVKDITPPNAADVLSPKTVVANVKVQTAGSMIDFVNRFKNENSMLFADVANDTVVSIIDYHTESAVDTGGIKPALATHRATLHLPKSQEWVTWNKAHDKLMSHRDFATFLEENSIDVVSPSGASLLELCRDLQVIQNVNFSSSIRMGDVTELAYEKKSDATDKGGLTMPTYIMLSIPVYFGEQPVPIKAYLRRKIDDGALFLGISLSRAENVRQDEFHRIVEAVTINVDHLTTVYGTPA
mgnify:CR=1 FL=1